ncbi:MAG: ABC transporter permease [Rectinemataceae bacterium]
MSAKARGAGRDTAPGLPHRLAGLFLTGNTFVITVLAFFSALVIGAIIIVFATPTATQAWRDVFRSPGPAFGASWKAIADAYGSLFAGSIGSPKAIVAAMGSGSPAAVSRALTPISETLVAATPLMLAALGIALAFRAGLFDIGGQGQLILGAAGATLGGFLLPGMPAFLHVIFALIVGAAFGAVWGFVPGILKAKTGAHEVITSMMLNYVALNLLTFLLTSELYQAPPRLEAVSKAVVPGARLPLLLGPSLRVNLGFVIAVLLVIGVAWLLKRSSTGFRFRMLGLNREATRVAGVNIEFQYVLAMTLAGMLVGLGGAMLVLGVDFRISPLYGGTIGFDGITVAILGRGTPLGVALSSLLFGAFTAGGRTMQVNTSIPLQLVQVLQAVLVLFVAAPGVIRTIYRIRVLHGGGRIFGGWAG